MKIKRREDKDQASTSIFGSFIGRLSKGKGYIPVEDSSKVDKLDQTFKVFKGKAFDEEIYTLANILDILGSLASRKSLELERIS